MSQLMLLLTKTCTSSSCQAPSSGSCCELERTSQTGLPSSQWWMCSDRTSRTAAMAAHDTYHASWAHFSPHMIPLTWSVFFIGPTHVLLDGLEACLTSSSCL